MVRQRILPFCAKGNFVFSSVAAGFIAGPAAAGVVVDTGSLDFGHKVIIEEQTRWRPGRIVRNDQSTVTLTGNGVTLTGPNAQDFLLSTSLTGGTAVTRLAPGRLELAFKPETVGPKQAEVVITTDDPANPATTLTLTGEGLPGRGTLITGLTPATGRDLVPSVLEGITAAWQVHVPMWGFTR